MILGLILASSLVIVPVTAYQGDDMTDEDFELFLDAHADMQQVVASNAKTVARGCVKGAAVGAMMGKGFKAICIGCVVNAMGDVVAELAVPREK